MRKALPVISEDAETLKQRLQREQDGRTMPRLPMLYLLASRQAQTCLEMAQLLGGHRNTNGTRRPTRGLSPAHSGACGFPPTVRSGIRVRGSGATYRATSPGSCS
jgi:hypothetical protein